MGNKIIDMARSMARSRCLAEIHVDLPPLIFSLTWNQERKIRELLPEDFFTLAHGETRLFAAESDSTETKQVNVLSTDGKQVPSNLDKI